MGFSDESRKPQIFSLHASDPHKQKLASAAQGDESNTAWRNVKSAGPYTYHSHIVLKDTVPCFCQIFNH